MRETQRTKREILDDLFCRDKHRVWTASCQMYSLSQNRKRVMELAPYRWRISAMEKRINPPNCLVPQNRFLRKAVGMIDFHRKNRGCPCCLLGEDSNPFYVIEDGYLELLEQTFLYPENVNYVRCLVKCRRCGAVYEVKEREYHFTWWEWSRMPDTDAP